MHDSFKVKATILSQQWMAWTATHTHTHKAMGLKIHDIEQPTYIFHTWQISMQDPARKLSYLCLRCFFFLHCIVTQAWYSRPQHSTNQQHHNYSAPDTTTIQPLAPQPFSPWHHNHSAPDTTTIHPAYTTTIQPLDPQHTQLLQIKNCIFLSYFTHCSHFIF